MIDKSKLTFKNRKEQLKKEAAVYEEKIVQTTGRWALIAGGAYIGLQILMPYVEHKLLKKNKVIQVPEIIPTPQKGKKRKNEDKTTSLSWRETLEQQLKEQVVNLIKAQATTFLVNAFLKKDEQQNTGADKKTK